MLKPSLRIRIIVRERENLLIISMISILAWNSIDLDIKNSKLLQIISTIDKIKLNFTIIHSLNQKWRDNYNSRSNLFLSFSLVYFISKLTTLRGAIRGHLSRRSPSSFKQSSNQSFTPTTLLLTLSSYKTRIVPPLQKLYVPLTTSPVFELQHHCSKPTSKRCWQCKSIFRLDTFI